MERWNELDYAETMYNTQSFLQAYCVTELTIYAKWLKYTKLQTLGKDYGTVTETELEEIEKAVREELIDFCERNYSDFNYTLHYPDINKAIENTKKAKLLIPQPVTITEDEYKTLIGIENDAYRRVMFILLVDAKFNKQNRVSLKTPTKHDDRYFTRLTRPEVYRLAKAKFSSKVEKNVNVWGYLGKNRLLEMQMKWENTVVTFVDTSENPQIRETVTDYKHLDLHYERMMGENIGECEICGKLFRQGKYRPGKYCYEHRRYQKIGVKKCVDCGKEFITMPNKIRCDCCQTIKKREDARKRIERYRQQKAV